LTISGKVIVDWAFPLKLNFGVNDNTKIEEVIIEKFFLLSFHLTSGILKSLEIDFCCALVIKVVGNLADVPE